MTFGQELYLFALAIPLIGILATLVFRKRIRSMSKRTKSKRVQATFAGVSEISSHLSQPSKWLFLIGLIFVIIALGRPRWGEVHKEVFKRSREVIIAMDLSKSMLAQDIKPNRLERAKLVVESLLDDLQGESVGLVVFAGTAFLQSPMSPDYQILRGFLKDLNPNFIPQGGTNYQAMLETSLDSFRQSDGEADRFLIVISDGESLNDNWNSQLEELNEQNVQAICLGFGTREGGLIPDGEGGYHKNSSGAVVLTKLEPDTLQSLADKTGGVYKQANVWVELASLIEKTVKRGKTGKTGSTSQSIHIERYQIFLAPGLLLILISLYREFPFTPKPRTIQPRKAHVK
jgi:Ca-activated chloride channel family protein|tara:strand:- start:1077 stop:2111 length:1035 start_codon:yes stop_codon:yes gene_type:complete